ncbi:hypothetical protein CKJ89_38325, partial [Klebsiella pneumoniae]
SGKPAGALLLPALARQEDRRQLLLLALALQLIGYSGSLLRCDRRANRPARCCSRRWLARRIGASFFC